MTADARFEIVQFTLRHFGSVPNEAGAVTPAGAASQDAGAGSEYHSARLADDWAELNMKNIGVADRWCRMDPLFDIVNNRLRDAPRAEQRKVTLK